MSAVVEAPEEVFDAADVERWPALREHVLPEFPVGVLPAGMAAWVHAIAEESQTPPDLAALAGLGVLSAAAMGRAEVDCGTWAEETPLYLLVAMPSGDRKSAVLRSAVEPLRRLEKERQDAAARAVREQLQRKTVLEKRMGKLTKTAAEGATADSRQQAEAELTITADELADIGEPCLPRLLADDATPEALGGLLARHSRIAIVAAESAFIDNLIGRYSESTPNLHLVCSAYSGEPTTIDRRGREAETLERPLLTIALTVQPHVLQKLVGHDIARAQGLVARFAYALPETQLGSRRIDATPAPAEVHDGWRGCVAHVAGADRTDTNRGSVGSVSVSRTPQLELSLEASGLLHQLRDELEPRLAEAGDLRPVADWVARHAGRVARIAGLLHLTEYRTDQVIGAETMRQALAIGEYLFTHSLAALAAPDPLTRRALRWLNTHSEDTVTQRDLQRGPLGARGNAEDARSLALTLVAHGALREIAAEHTGPGRPPSPTYAVSPSLKYRTEQNSV
jgi:Protein of unknown function (DUF3987)